MPDCVQLQQSWIRLHNLDNISNYFNELNNIDWFTYFFDKWDLSDFDEITEGMAYELTYNCNEHGLSNNTIQDLIKNVIEVSTKYGCIVNLTLKIFDDGDFTTYWIIKDNIINDLTDEINNFIQEKEKQYH